MSVGKRVHTGHTVVKGVLEALEFCFSPGQPPSLPPHLVLCRFTASRRQLPANCCPIKPVAFMRRNW